MDNLNLADLVLGNKATYFETSKLNSFDSVAVSFLSFVESTSDEKEHMLCLPITDRGQVMKEKEPFKVFLSDDAPSNAQSVKEKSDSAEVGYCFILDRVSKTDNSDLECGWINTVSKRNANTVLSGVTFIRDSEKEKDEDTGLLRIAMTQKAGGGYAPKTRPNILTIFPQYAASFSTVDLDSIREVMKSIINNPIGTGQTNCIVRVVSSDGDGKLFEFSGMKDADNNYADIEWDSLKEFKFKQNQFSDIIESVEKFIAKKNGSDVVLEVMPGLIHYPGKFTAQSLSSLSNQATLDNYSLITEQQTKDRHGFEIPLVLNGGRKSFVGIELGNHSTTKVIPINHNTYTNELGLNSNSLKGKTKSQITKDEKDNGAKKGPSM